MAAAAKDTVDDEDLRKTTSANVDTMAAAESVETLGAGLGGLSMDESELSHLLRAAGVDPSESAFSQLTLSDLTALYAQGRPGFLKYLAATLKVQPLSRRQKVANAIGKRSGVTAWHRRPTAGASGNRSWEPASKPDATGDERRAPLPGVRMRECRVGACEAIGIDFTTCLRKHCRACLKSDCFVERRVRGVGEPLVRRAGALRGRLTVARPLGDPRARARDSLRVRDAGGEGHAHRRSALARGLARL